MTGTPQLWALPVPDLPGAPGEPGTPAPAPALTKSSALIR